jgi:hypothetical protein
MTREGRKWILGVICICVFILICSGVVYSKSVVWYVKQADKHLQQGMQYGKEGKYAQSEAECTQAVIMLTKARKRAIEDNLNIIAFDMDSHKIMAYVYFTRGLALYLQGDLYCAWRDFRNTSFEIGELGIDLDDRVYIPPKFLDLRKQAEQWEQKALDEMHGTDREGREKCPPEVHMLLDK